MASKRERIYTTVAMSLVAVCLVFPASNGRALADELTPVTLLLPWYHQFQFAGYYAAQMQGYYADVGLEVSIEPSFADGEVPRNTVEDIVFNRVQYAVGRTELLIHHSNGLPVVVLANVFQRSPLIFASLERYEIDRLEDIGDRPVSLTLPSGQPGETLSAETLTALAKAGVDPTQLNNNRRYWSVDDLLEGHTQLIPAFNTDEPYVIERHGEQPAIIEPSDYTVDFYGDMLFTSQQHLEAEPEQAEAFVEASLRGWQYAMENPDSVADYILAHYPTRGELYDRDFLLQEAAVMQDYIRHDLVELGYINRHRWQNIAETHANLGLIGEYDLDRFLYHTEQLQTNWRTMVPAFGSLGVVLMLVMGVSYWLYRSNRRLRTEIGRRREAETALRHLAEKDALTGLENRHQFHHHITTAFAQARADQTPLSIIMMDVDHFKTINDDYGHLFGDQVLREIATVSEGEIRDTDHICRYGGEEFVVVLSDTPIDVAEEVAQRILQANREHQIHHDGDSIRYTVSIGIAELSPEDAHVEALINRADRCLYQAKLRGRNQIQL